MSLKLYTNAGNPRAAKGLIAAQYTGVAVETPAFQWGDNKKPEFLKKNPLGKVPVLETEHGAIFESNAIARYIARMRPDAGLYGQTFHESGLVDQWIDFAATTIEGPVGQVIYPIFGFAPFNAEAHKKALDDLKTFLKVVDAHLMTRTYLVGHQVTLADIVLATTLLFPFKMVLDVNQRKSFVNLTRWFETCVNQPEFKAVLGKVHLCAKAQTGYEGINTARPTAPAAEKPKEEKKKEEKKPKKKEEEEEEEENYDDEPKNKKPNELDLLPPSKMVMDNWKKVYSNTKDLYGVAMPQFWEMYDPEGYSLWTCVYEKAEGEGKVLFMTSNLVSGFLQRLDKLRKYAFGTMGVFGEEPNLEIEGCWVFRGKEIPFEMRDHPSFEYHKWVRLDHTSEADRKLVADYWCSDDGVNGKRLRDGKVYK